MTMIGECECLQWQQTKIPCLHAIAAARDAGLLANMRAWYDHAVERCYHTAHYKAALLAATVELPSLRMLESDGKTLPPAWVIQAGRPRTRRIRSVGEQGGSAAPPRKRRRIVCARCGQDGHNVRTCNNAPEWA